MTYQMALLESKLDGFEKGRQEGHVETALENLCSVMDSLKVTAEKAMEILKVPKDEHSYYLDKLNQ